MGLVARGARELHGTPLEAGNAGRTTDLAVSELPQVGSLFADRFELRSILGQGGMAVVYRAKQLHLQREVALKILRPEVVSAGYELQRFEREALVAARLKTVHAVRIFDSGTSSTGLSFLVLELLEGRTLAEEIAARGRIGVAEAVQWAADCAEALAEAAALGIVHRDIKPANIFLAARGGAVRAATLLDFGITKIGTAEDGPTQGVRRLGTVSYMSPEQLRAPAAVDPRADLWSLAVVLYEALAGSPPFNAEFEADRVVSILSAEPAWLSDVAPAVPPRLARVIHRCLKKRPEDRYADAGEFAHALRSAISGPARQGRFGRPGWRVAGALIAGALTAPLTVGGEIPSMSPNFGRGRPVAPSSSHAIAPSVQRTAEVAAAPAPAGATQLDVRSPTASTSICVQPDLVRPPAESAPGLSAQQPSARPSQLPRRAPEPSVPRLDFERDNPYEG